MSRAIAVVAAVSLAVLAPAARAQGVAPSLTAGVAVPTGDYGINRTPGPLLRAGLTLQPARSVQLRVEGESAWMLDRSAGSTLLGSSHGTLRARGVMLTLVAGPRLKPVAPYVLLGMGPQWLHIDGVTNPYGATLGARVGVGLRVRVGRLALEAEVADHGVATDFGTGHDFKIGSYVPVSVSVRF